MKIIPSKIKDSSLIVDSYECVEGNDSYLLLSGGFCGEDEFIQKELDASGSFFLVRLAAHVSNGLKSRIRPVVGRI